LNHKTKIIDIGDGIPAYYRISGLENKCPPIKISIEYSDPKSRLNCYGDFKNERPS
jgi:hypothetical protein